MTKIEFKYDLNDQVWFIHHGKIRSGIITNISYFKNLIAGEVYEKVMYSVSYEGTKVDIEELELYTSKECLVSIISEEQKSKKETFWQFVEPLSGDKLRCAMQLAQAYVKIGRTPDDALEEIKKNLSKIQ